jgi:LysR family nitrogen assimilation transcriptional regulator
MPLSAGCRSQIHQSLCDRHDYKKIAFRDYLIFYLCITDFPVQGLAGQAGYPILRYMSMDIKQLEGFVRVAELGSFTKASAMLGISQPVLSRQVRQLELELKKHLLYRNGRGVTTTESGKRLLAHGKGILRQVELARQELEDEDIAPVGKVVVGLPPSVGKLLTVRMVSKFRRQYSKASIGIVEGLTAAMQEWLMLGRLDFALLYNPTPAPQLDYERIWSEDLYLISPSAAKPRPSASVRMADLGRYPLIIPSSPNTIRDMIEAECGRKNVMLDIALEIDAIPAILDLVEQGFGHAILSRYAVHGRERRGTLHAARIVGPSITSHLVIATSTQRPLARLARKTAELIKSEITRDILAPVPAKRKSGTRRNSDGI